MFSYRSRIIPGTFITHIVPMLGYIENHERTIIIMPLIDGQNLDHLLFGKGLLDVPALLPREQCCSIALQLAEGVAYMHMQNPVIINQDLKPRNVMPTIA